MTGMMTDVAIEDPPDRREVLVGLDRVRRTYNGDVVALNDVSLTITRGELVAVVGPSGSGKSTLLNLIGTLDHPTTGTVRLDGIDISELSDRALSGLRAELIGFVFQHFHLAAGQTVLNNVADGLLYSGVPRRERRIRAAEICARVGLEHRLGHFPRQLSGGERQRTAIARAVVGDPALLLADEPTGNLDTKSGADVLAILHELNSAGTTVVLITHDRDLAAGRSWSGRPRLVAMVDGALDPNPETASSPWSTGRAS